MIIHKHSSKHILAFTGGVGGAKLALGLSKNLDPKQLTLVANTADDFEHLGLYISPDLDTVMYTLAQMNNQTLGWGLADESWNTFNALKILEEETWFQLGDKDMATHLVRSQHLAKGETLTQVTQLLCEKLNVQHRLLPMTDDPVRTRIKTLSGELAFQEYFVREQCQPVITDIYFEGIKQAQAQTQLMELLHSTQLTAIIICPSNPFVSVAPILQLPGVREAIRSSPAPVIAVSPIVGGTAIKGPAAKMMRELCMEVSSSAIANYYGDLLDAFVIDHNDKKLQTQIEKQNLKVCCTNTVMKTLNDRIELASDILKLVDGFSNDRE